MCARRPRRSARAPSRPRRAARPCPRPTPSPRSAWNSQTGAARALSPAAVRVRQPLMQDDRDVVEEADRDLLRLVEPAALDALDDLLVGARDGLDRDHVIDVP